MLPDGTTRSGSKAFFGHFPLVFPLLRRFSCCVDHLCLCRAWALALAPHTHSTQWDPHLVSSSLSCIDWQPFFFFLSLSLVMSAPFFHARLTPNGKRSLWVGQGDGGREREVVACLRSLFSHCAWAWLSLLLLLSLSLPLLLWLLLSLLPPLSLLDFQLTRNLCCKLLFCISLCSPSLSHSFFLWSCNLASK